MLGGEWGHDAELYDYLDSLDEEQEEVDDIPDEPYQDEIENN